MFQLLNSTTDNISLNYSLTSDIMKFCGCLKDVSLRALEFRNQELDFTNPGAEGKRKLSIKNFDEFKSLPAPSAAAVKLLR